MCIGIDDVSYVPEILNENVDKCDISLDVSELSTLSLFAKAYLLKSFVSYNLDLIQHKVRNITIYVNPTCIYVATQMKQNVMDFVSARDGVLNLEIRKLEI